MPPHHANASEGQVHVENCTCSHTETEVADQNFFLTQSPKTDTGSANPSTDPITQGA